jgi:hypothetical protein
VTDKNSLRFLAYIDAIPLEVFLLESATSIKPLRHHSLWPGTQACSATKFEKHNPRGAIRDGTSATDFCF